MGLAVLNLKLRHKTVEPFEDETAHSWVVSTMGQPAWDRVWGPLMRGKFGSRAEDISMAWLWARLTVRREVKGSQVSGEVLGYPEGTFERLFGRLREEIEAGGGRVLIDQPAAHIESRDAGFAVSVGAPDSFRAGHDPRSFRVDGVEVYDKVLRSVS
jgi:protoporphyrinogen oxidase